MTSRKPYIISEETIESLGISFRDSLEESISDPLVIFNQLKYPNTFVHEQNMYRELISIIPQLIGSNKIGEESESLEEICKCQHFDVLIVNEIINYNVETVYNEIYSQNSNFLYRIGKLKNMQNLCITERMKEEECDYQILTHDYPNAFLGKTAKNTIKIKYNQNSRSRVHHMIDYECHTAGVPFGSTFVCFIRVCISKIDDKSCLFKVSWKIKFLRDVWGITKNTISQRSVAVAKDIMKEYPILLREILSKNENAGSLVDISEQDIDINSSDTSEIVTQPTESRNKPTINHISYLYISLSIILLILVIIVNRQTKIDFILKHQII